MTDWLAGTRLPPRFTLGQHCDLRDPLHQANVIRARAQELATAEVRNHLEAGKTVASLGLQWSDRLQFVLAEDLSASAIKYLDVRERDEGYEGEDDAAELARLDGDFVLMSMELDKLVEDLIEIFGSSD
jgi:recombination associated protein RdgC